MKCPKCGRPAIEVRIGNHATLLDEAPDPERGQVLALNGIGVFLDGNALFDARRNHLPLFTRHGIHCPQFWRQDV